MLKRFRQAKAMANPNQPNLADPTSSNDSSLPQKWNGRPGSLEDDASRAEFLFGSATAGTDIEYLPGKTSDDDLVPSVDDQPDWSWLLAISNRIHQADDRDTLFNLTVAEIRQYLKADRVLLYHFQTDRSGVVLAESMTNGYTPSLGERLPAIIFGTESIPGDASQVVAVDDVSLQSLSPYQIQMLGRYQVKASLSIPILLDQLWGLLVVQQCSQPRRWSNHEISLLYQIVTELRLSLQPLDFRNQQQALALLSEKIRQTADLETIFQIATREIRKRLGVERVAICKFRPDYFSDFVAESKAEDLPAIAGHAWEETYIQDLQGGRLRDTQPLLIEDTESHVGLNEAQRDIWRNAEVRAGAITALFQGKTLWGVLSAYQHSAPRRWLPDDIRFLTQMSNLLGVALQQAALVEERDHVVQHSQAVSAIAQKIKNASYVESACETAVQEVRQRLDVERVAIYKFRPDFFGDFVYESESGGWPKLVGSAWEDTYLQETQGGRFRNYEPYVADDVYTAGLSDCHIASLEYFGVKAFLIVAIKQGDKLWGLLSAFQHSGPRHWRDSEGTLLANIGRQLETVLQEGNYLVQLQAQSAQLAKAAQVDHAVVQLIPKILQSQDLPTLFRLTTQSVRHLLKVDRVAIYRFDPDWSSKLIAESVTKGLDALINSNIGAIWPQTKIQETQGGEYRNRANLVVNNIYTAGHSRAEIEQLEELEVKAYVIAPIFKDDQLWGLLGIYQNSEARSWAEAEVSALRQIGLQVGAAMQRVDYLEQLHQQSEQLAQAAARDRLLTKIVERIRRSLDLPQIFKTTAREVRNTLDVDRVVVYQFEPESSYNRGTVVAEDIRPGHLSILATKLEDTCFGERHAERYKQGRIFAIADIHQADVAPCYIDMLSQFQVRGNLVVPLFRGEDLWGLFCIHQCSGPRQWQTADIEFTKQIATQLDTAIQQGEYVEQLRQATKQLAEAAEREKSAKEQLQQEVVQLLLTVRPALDGDLTVRAPITDTEVGTIADAYNNTLGSLRQIVIQMQAAARQVAQTSQTSETAIASLTAQAQQQFHTLAQAQANVERMVHSTEAVGTSAQQVAAAVQQANQIVLAGDSAMDQTVEGILDIRKTVAETNKRLQRLSESSQKISKVVNLISNFTTQTQLLALNASIEATRAGEYGRGFAVVADEVRSLARQSADAATDIEQLVQEIQRGTAEVSTVLETGIHQVAEGTDLVTDARENLSAIMEATSLINQLVASITQSTQEQTQQFRSVTQTINEVAAIANRTSEESVTLTASFQELLATARLLQSKSGQFKVVK